MLAGIFLIIALINKPSLLLFFASAKTFFSLVLVAFAAFLATLGIYNFAEAIFGRTELPWYARPGGMVFLVAALFCINAVFMFFGKVLSNVLRTELFFVQEAYIYLFMVFELLWIVLLEWVSYQK